MTGNLVTVRCPDCARANNAAEVLSVPGSLAFAVVPKERRPGG
jgi:hypothetical protein